MNRKFRNRGLRQIGDVLGIEATKIRRYEFLTPTSLGKCFIPNIRATHINLILEKAGYIEKNPEGEWHATEKGKPLVHSYKYGEIILEGSGTIYWKKADD